MLGVGLYFYLGGLTVVFFNAIIAILQERRALSKIGKKGRLGVTTLVAVVSSVFFWPLFLLYSLFLAVTSTEISEHLLDVGEKDSSSATVFFPAAATQEEKFQAGSNDMRCIKCGNFYDISLRNCPECGTSSLSQLSFP